MIYSRKELDANTISIIIPVFNEQETLQVLYDRIVSASSAWNDEWELVLVDDGSIDLSFSILVKLHHRDPRVKVVSFSRNFGHQTAVSASLAYCCGDVAIVMDADLQDPPEQVIHFLQKWREGYQVVYAIRQKQKEKWFKRIAYFCFYRTLAWLSSISIPLDSGDFCVMDRVIVDHLNAMPERNRFVRGLRAWIGYSQIGIPYERSARSFAKPLLKQKQRSQASVKILDLGCGPGNLISRLTPRGEVIGVDASEDALAFCEQKHSVLTQKVDSVPFPFADNTFDFIFAIEVIEHIEDDLEAAKEIYRVLKPGGTLIAIVPAFMFLWGSHDEMYGHYRRYTRKRICNLAQNAGFTIYKSRYFKLLFFFPLLIMRKLKNSAGKKGDDFYKVNKFTNQFFRSLINAETPLVSTIRFPFGSSIISIFQKA